MSPVKKSYQNDHFLALLHFTSLTQTRGRKEDAHELRLGRHGSVSFHAHGDGGGQGSAEFAFLARSVPSSWILFLVLCRCGFSREGDESLRSPSLSHELLPSTRAAIAVATAILEMAAFGVFQGRDFRRFGSRCGTRYNAQAKRIAEAGEAKGHRVTELA
jgi:hypothetical protein